jgi:hypothetical protein
MRRSAFAFAFLASVGAAACGGEQGVTDSASAAETFGRSVHLTATDNTQVSLRYRVAEDLGQSDRHTYATDITLGVDNSAWHPGGPGGRSIRAVLLSYCAPSGGAAEVLAYEEQLDVSYTQLQGGSGFGFELQLATLGDEVDRIPMYMTSIAGANHCREEISVVVDGVWLEDPINHTHNFRFDLAH